MRLPTRRTLCLSATMVMLIVGGFWLLAPRSRITQANFDRIREGMSEAEVKTILGEENDPWPESIGSEIAGIIVVHIWDSGINHIEIGFKDGRVTHDKVIYHRSALRAVQWYAKEVASKVGITWQ